MTCPKYTNNTRWRWLHLNKYITYQLGLVNICGSKPEVARERRKTCNIISTVLHLLDPKCVLQPPLVHFRHLRYCIANIVGHLDKWEILDGGLAETGVRYELIHQFECVMETRVFGCFRVTLYKCSTSRKRLRHLQALLVIDRNLRCRPTFSFLDVRLSVDKNPPDEVSISWLECSLFGEFPALSLNSLAAAFNFNGDWGDWSIQCEIQRTL